MKQVIRECPSALTRLFEVVPEPMRHDCHSNGLDIFGKKHLASVHQRPSLRGVEQCEAGARRYPVMWRCREASSRSCR